MFVDVYFPQVEVTKSISAIFPGWDNSDISLQGFQHKPQMANHQEVMCGHLWISQCRFSTTRSRFLCNPEFLFMPRVQQEKLLQ